MNTSNNKFTTINNNLKYIAILNQLRYSSHKHATSNLLRVLCYLYRTKNKGKRTISNVSVTRSQLTALTALYGFGLLNLNHHRSHFGLEITNFTLTDAGCTFLNKFIGLYINKKPTAKYVGFKVIAGIIFFIAICDSVLLLSNVFKMGEVTTSASGLKELNTLMDNANECLGILLFTFITGLIFMIISMVGNESTTHQSFTNITTNVTELDMLLFLIQSQLIKHNLNRIDVYTITALKDDQLFTKKKLPIYV